MSHRAESCSRARCRLSNSNSKTSLIPRTFLFLALFLYCLHIQSRNSDGRLRLVVGVRHPPEKRGRRATRTSCTLAVKRWSCRQTGRVNQPGSPAPREVKCCPESSCAPQNNLPARDAPCIDVTAPPRITCQSGGRICASGGRCNEFSAYRRPCQVQG